jgi:hypothetical protein
VTNVGWSDALAKLEKAEQADERAHRGFGPNYAQYHRPVSVNHCARLQILHQAGEGAKRGVMPPATDFLVCRRAAIEAQILGVLVAPHAPAGWIDACVALDYAAVVSKPDAA